MPSPLRVLGLFVPSLAVMAAPVAAMPSAVQGARISAEVRAILTSPQNLQQPAQGSLKLIIEGYPGFDGAQEPPAMMAKDIHGYTLQPGQRVMQ